MAISVVMLVAALFSTIAGIVSSQDDACRTPKPSVGAREYLVGANSYHVPVMDYLTELVGPDFDPPISFRRETANVYLKTPTVQESLALGYDFMLHHPYAVSCYESEGQAVSLATQIIRNPGEEGEYFNLTEYGATLYVLKHRTDINTVSDVKGKKIGSNKITNLATHLCYDVLLRNGVHHLQDPEQTIFFANSDAALAALLRGDVDVGCAATGTLEKYTDPETGQRLDLSQIRILHAQNHTLDDGMAFPYVISSPLVPGYPFVAFPHVEQSVQVRVQQELLAMRDHADAAPALLACLDEAGCLVNETGCLDTCFNSLPNGTIRNCDTTPQLALKAFDALNRSGLVGFSKPLQNFLLRDIQETTGFLIKDSPSPRCVRMNNIADAVTCPEGHFVRSSQEIVQQCNVSGLPCFDRDCICRPCVKAYEVDFFAVAEPFEGNTREEQPNNNNFVGSGCAKFSICGTVEQEHVLSFWAIDNKGRQGASMTGALLREDETEEPFIFEYVNGTYQYDFTASRKPVGQQVIKIRINGEEIPESPFRINIIKRDCAADTGDDGREADNLGQCKCQSGTVELGDTCTPLATLLPSILIPLTILVSFVLCVCLGGRRRKEEAVWMVRKDEIKFDTPPHVLGRGAFGEVLLGEFRGTQVAVKRVIPFHVNTATAQDDSYKDEDDIEEGCTASSPQGQTTNTKHERRPETAPVRNGLTEMLARLSAADMLPRSNGDSMLFTDMRKLRKDFIDEMRVLSRLRHPNVTTLMGAALDEEDAEGPLLIMEYMDRGSLWDVLHDDDLVLQEENLHSMLQDVANGMRYLHASDPPVIHGDLKARNILVDSKFRAKVADLGLAHSQKELKRAVGSPYWMAPELLRGGSTNTTASDIYSFGVILYEVYSKKEPYAGEDPSKVLKDVADPSVNKRPSIPSSCPSQIKSLMEDCFAAKPEQRPTFEEIDRRLKRFQAISEAKDDSFGCDRSSKTSLGSSSPRAANNATALNITPADDSAAPAEVADFFLSSLAYRLRNRKQGTGQ